MAKRKDIYIRLLHSFQHDGVSSHPEIIISTPDLNFSLSIRGMGNGKFCRKPIDGVEVTVRFVVVLLLQLVRVELVIIKSIGVGRALLRNLRRALRRFSSGRGLGGFEGIAAFLRGGQFFCHSGSGKGLTSMGAFLDAARGHVDALVPVNLDDVNAVRNASKVLDLLSGTFGEGGAHDRAFGGLFGKLSEAGEAWRGRGAQSAERGGLRTTQEGARRGELCKRRELVHNHQD
jgi:hypothetical protein